MSENEKIKVNLDNIKSKNGTTSENSHFSKNSSE